ncbi:SURF1 family protein [Erythrobacteraceae bacterium CFH 75059]|uniref:SURF1 family protein n=1 Tax=Qipengyuania thermophila TaxID=2509361 RepID=UPI00102205A3|nr:SURF1 family protein [Qipengyuania thermophila]TCD04944.1 SURF1 family protein [Erythrobacteraceae bacterium CFH 75059]
MTLRQVPLVPTVLVVVAVAVMIALGVWQLGRAEEKRALIAQYRAAVTDAQPAAFPHTASAAARVLYRRTQVRCVSASPAGAVSGTSADGRKGWAHRARCRDANGRDVLVDLGFSDQPVAPSWRGGSVAGVIAPGPRLVADPPLAGLSPLRRPDPSDLPDNHLAYAIQWFVFAGVAVAIYVLALRRRSTGS